MSQPCNMETVKIVAVGDEAVGKTSLLVSFTTNTFSEEYKPTVFETYTITAVVYGKDINVSLWDTSGQEGYDRFRPLQYSQTWYPEIRYYCSNTPVILVGTKLDLREASELIDLPSKTKSTFVTHLQGFSRAVDIGAVKYIECSSVTQQGLRYLFDEAIEAVLMTPKATRQQYNCKII